ncbi:hypothetical protein G6514_008265 [Epicoccum nigrum]|nr:hypothetical protein G6514_008265 [Epicoccum nigrum]
MAIQAGKRRIKLTERGSQLSELLSRYTEDTNNSSQNTQSTNRRSTQSSNRRSTRSSNRQSSSNLSSAHPSRHQRSSDADSVVPETPRITPCNNGLSGDSLERELDNILASNDGNKDENEDDDEYDDEEDDENGRAPESEDSDVANELSVFDAPRVKFTAKFRALLGGKPIYTSLSTREHTSKNLHWPELFRWADQEVERQLPVPVTYKSVTAFVYLVNDAKKDYVAENLFKDDPVSWRRFLVSLQQKKKEQRMSRKRKNQKAIGVDFNLYLEIYQHQHMRS